MVRCVQQSSSIQNLEYIRLEIQIRVTMEHLLEMVYGAAVFTYYCIIAF